ncbi:DUF3159 domain-containing protein [Bombiscardovia coagulans]|uniref:Zinc ABC transporter permease n=1 Tax=Bombiscardovia coagulans TaxID=686666 RepID=A0A261EP13_9BIFI|nr:DUF3159 domain-containing protein [Bombiscardovia coagulans]OZG48605.1 zinc ABC transporter permease [Bombiscardovia coagulans]
MAGQLKTGLSAIGSDDFNVYEAVGGARGIAESVLPGFVFLLVFACTRQLQLTILIAGILAIVQLLIRLCQRQSWLGALTGMVSVAICLIWAWLSKDARNYYVPGFIANVVWIVGLGGSLLCKLPSIGFIIEYIRQPVLKDCRVWIQQWRQDEKLYKAYWRVTLLWLVMFVLRLGVQLPLYVSHRLTWLGTTRLVMGLPLFAMVIWFSWLFIIQPYHDHYHPGESTEQQ